MKAEQIKQALEHQGYSLSLLATALDLNLSQVSGVVHRHNTSYRVASAISIIIKKDISEVFPEITSYQNNEQTRAKKVQAIRELIAKG